MTALLRALMLRQGAAPQPPAGGGNRMRLGVNAGAFAVWTRNPGPVNLVVGSLKGGSSANGSRKYLVEAQDGSNVPTDTDGWPSADFRAFTRCGPIATPYLVTCEFKGKVSSVSWAMQRGGSSLSAVSYNAGTNTSTFTFMFDPAASGDGGPGINFNGTQRDAGASVGSGVTDIWMWAPNYVGNKSQYWSDEMAQMFADFAVIRAMDWQDINNDKTTLGWPAGATSDAFDSVRSIIGLANQFGKDLWMQIPVNATSDWDNGFFAYADANLREDLKLYFGYSNETWNPGFYAFSRCLVLTAIETRGAAGELTGRKIASISGDGTTATVTVDYSVDLSVGESIRWTGFDGDATKTVASVGTNTFTFASSYSGTATPNSRVWFVSKDTTSNLIFGNEPYNLYGLAGNLAARRIVEASDRCRAIVGNTKMMTRFRPIQEHQGINNDGLAKLQFIANLVGGAGVVKDKIYGLGGAPYFYIDLDPDNDATRQNDGSPHTVADYVGYYGETMPAIKTQYQHAQRVAQAIKYGVKVCYYEGGAEQTGDTGNSQNNYNKNQAKLTPEFGALYLQFMKDMSMCGVDLFAHYNSDNWINTGQKYCYGFTDNYDHVTPYWQAFKDFNAIADEDLPAINVLQGVTVLDGRLKAGRFPPASGSYPALGNNTNRRAAYLVTTKAAGSWSVVMNAAANSTTTYTVEVNGVQQVSSRNMQVSNTYPALDVFNDAAPWALSLAKGVNVVEIICGEAHGSGDQAIKSLTFTPA